MVVPLLRDAASASAPWRPSQASHEVIPMTVKFGGCLCHRLVREANGAPVPRPALQIPTETAPDVTQPLNSEKQKMKQCGEDQGGVRLEGWDGGRGRNSQKPA